MSLINTQVQPFKTEAFVNRGGKGEFITVSDESLKGKVVGADFHARCFHLQLPTEIEDAANSYEEFRRPVPRSTS